MANTKEIIARMAEITEGTKKESEKQLMAFLKVLEECVENKEDVKLTGHFSMSVVDRAERQGNNPKTLEKITIPATKAVKVKIGKKLKDLAKQ